MIDYLPKSTAMLAGHITTNCFVVYHYCTERNENNDLIKQKFDVYNDQTVNVVYIVVFMFYK